MELVPLLSILSLWVGCTSAQEIRPGPGVVNVPEGDDALLPCALSSGQSIDEFDWRKDNGNEAKKEVFMYNRGSYYGDGKTKGQSQEFTNRVEFFQHELASGNASIIIKNTRLEDNGTYTCGLGLLRHNRQEVHIRLNVDAVLKIRNVIGAARMPYIQTIQDQITWRLLVCNVHGVPEPEVEWRNSAGKVLVKHNPKHEEGHVQLKLNVSKSDNYTCVATQRNFYHQTNNMLDVSIPDAVEAVAVSEGDNAVLPCSFDSKNNIENNVFFWSKDNEQVLFYNKGLVEDYEKVKGRLTLFQQELKSGNASIKIYNTQKSDSGRYTCYFPDIQKSHVVLQVVETSHVWKTISGVVGFFLIVALIVVGILAKLLCKKNKHKNNTKENVI